MSADRLAGERLAFDAGFAAAPAAAPEETVRLLSVRAGGDRLLLRLSELGGVARDRRIVKLPSATAGLLGMVGIRGKLVPVFSLARLLGGQDESPPTWLAICAGAQPAAVAFAALDGHVEAPRSSIYKAGRGAGVREIARLDGASVPVVELAALLPKHRKETV